MSLVIEADIAFSKVSTLEHTNAKISTTNAQSMMLLSPIRVKKASDGSSTIPLPAATVPKNPITNTKGNTNAEAIKAPFFNDLSSLEAQVLCQFPCENISAAVIARTIAKPDLKVSMYVILPFDQDASYPAGLYAFASLINSLISLPNSITSNTEISTRITPACTLSVLSDAGSPPNEVYAAVTIATAIIGIIGFISVRYSIPLPIAVNSANKNVNM
ncbi:MAG: Uncharacterised protein [Methanobacteriota archaeon]|nr:MAG: Uncharacterised protein [Euryarchaeota archaeon]